jgi:ATP-dependent DNA helicase RecQ
MMAARRGPDERLAPDQPNTLIAGALFLDLEVSHRGRILKAGALLGDNAMGGSWAAIGADLIRLAGRARCLIGHNLLRHDLPALRDADPNHPLLRLPVIDTLVLSPIAFPENPYHRLVKDYKLVSESINDPVADARQASVLLSDEFRSLTGLRSTEPGLFELLHFLLATPDKETPRAAEGMGLLFHAAGGVRPSEARALTLCRELFQRFACRGVTPRESDLRTAQGRLALAYVVAWLRVAGSNSVLPPWVRLEHPTVREWITRLRDTPCKATDCAYCRRAHDAREQLRAFFGLDDFRPAPPNPQGGSLQRDIVEAGLRNESLLAILPTGAGKSLCYQLPALVRNLRRGTLTIVISPLQALMKDQVDGLVRRTGTPFAAALYGLLTPPERGDVLRRIRLGDVAILYVSPEQLRNRSFREAIAAREVGCWVFDEAHCLSKWGHDFRPDYLYAGRFIREFSKSQNVPIPSIACFTATAKHDVRAEIVEFFRQETGRDLALHEGGVERENLRFEVQTIGEHDKLERIHDLLATRFDPHGAGSAIVFRVTRQATRESAEYLQSKGWRAAHFHAGLTPPEKKRVQDQFLDGTTQVICATNAFGMGIDKEDVRLVVHADTPGSLENYLQEAGRAGRDGRLAECVLLYNDADCEHQFRMGAFSELSRRDIAQILRGLRKASRAGREEIVITSGELLRDEDVDTAISLEDSSADTKVRTAVAWLERAGFLERNENVTSVFQARPLVRSLVEAESRMVDLNLSKSERALWLAILRVLMNAEPTDSLTVDQLALLPEFVSYAQHGVPGASPPTSSELREASVAYAERANHDYISAKILRILRGMAQAGLVKRDTLLNAYLRHKVPDHSRVRLDRILAIDRKMVDLLALESPDPEGWMPLSLRQLNQRLLDESLPASIDLVRLLLKSLTEDGRGFAASHGSIELRPVSRDTCRVRVRRSWSALSELAEKRRRVASLVLDTLVTKIPTDTPPAGDLLVEFSFEELRAVIERDPQLRAELKDIDAALERALMYLHEQRVITLQQGLAIFRSAMTIRLRPEARGEPYRPADYQPLEHHYHERVFQVHVMSEYARRGLERIREALHLVLAYFSVDKETFIHRFLGAKPHLLEHATTAHSFQKIVTDLANPAQIRIVTAPAHRNILVLAGPGSGKTKTIVHRCAYLLRVQRVRPSSVLVCCFNRHAALELRRRLADLVGPDARGVTVLTYHALAIRLLGRSFSTTRNPPGNGPDLDSLIPEATALLRGESTPAGLEPDEIRDRLLAGFEHILVDEYQDIDEPQYNLISALAGRTLDDPDRRLTILAVGDDDQNIYGFRGANIEFIRRFEHDYAAEAHSLVENFRSTRYVIEAANELINANNDRMKTGTPIRVDEHRELLPPGGEFGRRDRLTGGRVQRLRVPDERSQAAAAIAELQRLRDLGVTDWSNIAVLSRTHRELAHVRALAEEEAIPVRWWADRSRMPPLHQVREIHAVLRELDERRRSFARASGLIELARRITPEDPTNPWSVFLHRLLDDWRCDSDDADLSVQEAIEFLYETCAETRRDFSYGTGVNLSTVHAAKGTEHDHVLILGAWPLDHHPTAREETRRLLYVAMTRARHSLTILDRTDVHPSLLTPLAGAAVLRRDAEPPPAGTPSPAPQYTTLGLDDIHLGYPSQFPKDHSVHAALAALAPNQRLSLRLEPQGIGLVDRRGTCVARLSRKAEVFWQSRLHTVREVRIVAMIHRGAEQEGEVSFTRLCRVPEWEIPVVELTSTATTESSVAEAD